MPSTKSTDHQILKLDTLKRVQVSQASRDAILDKFEHSDLNGAAFAKLHGIKYSTFAAWARRRRVNPLTPQPPKLSLAEIVVETQRPSSCSTQTGPRLHLPGGAWLDLDTQADSLQQVAQLLKALQA